VLILPPHPHLELQPPAPPTPAVPGSATSRPGAK